MEEFDRIKYMKERVATIDEEIKCLEDFKEFALQAIAEYESSSVQD